jgi:hypothetical protein
MSAKICRTCQSRVVKLIREETLLADDQPHLLLSSALCGLLSVMQDYVSPYIEAAAHERENFREDAAKRFDRSLKRDLELFEFLRDITNGLRPELIPELRVSFRTALGQFGALPAFRCVPLLQILFNLNKVNGQSERGADADRTDITGCDIIAMSQHLPGGNRQERWADHTPSRGVDLLLLCCRGQRKGIVQPVLPTAFPNSNSADG